jgi:hypothetical protein
MKNKLQFPFKTTIFKVSSSFFQIAAFCPNCQLNCSLAIAIIWLFYGNSVLNPIIYTAFNSKFRLAFRKLIGC